MSELVLDENFWLDRLIIEYGDLKEKQDSLDKFRISHWNLPMVDQSLLECQSKAMGEYLLCLETRLKRYNLWNKTINYLNDRFKESLKSE